MSSTWNSGSRAVLTPTALCHRKMDILNSDLQLRGEATSKKRSKSQDANDFESGFHFIAFMPAMGQVWKFDGLERQPQALGEFLCHGLLVGFSDLVR